MRAKEKTSKYWGVCRDSRSHGKKSSIEWSARHQWQCAVIVPGGKVKKSFPTEREAAIHADRVNLQYKLGKPLNILKPKP